MPWLQLSLDVSSDQAPILELLFEDMGALSVTLGDAGNEPILEPAPGDTRLWRATRVTALFAGERDPEQLRTLLTRTLNPAVSQRISIDRLNDEIWERAWLNDFRPMRFGERLWICPEGETPENAERAVVVRMDPGLAFGTGAHPTTALCLQWLDGADLAGKTIIDYGCGSGILAISALRLGAAAAIAIDHDPLALEATWANAEKNQVQDRLSLHDNDDSLRSQVDIVLANILAAPLIALADTLGARIKAEGHIVLSGILTSQAEEVGVAYSRLFQIRPPLAQAEWILLVGRRYG